MKSNVSIISTAYLAIKVRILKFMLRRLAGFSTKGPDYKSLQAIHDLHTNDSIIAVGLQMIKGKTKEGMCLVRFSVCSRYLDFTRTSVMEYWVSYRSYELLEKSIQKKFNELGFDQDKGVPALTLIWCANGSTARNITDDAVTNCPIAFGAPGNGVDRLLYRQ